MFMHPMECYVVINSRVLASESSQRNTKWIKWGVNIYTVCYYPFLCYYKKDKNKILLCPWIQKNRSWKDSQEPKNNNYLRDFLKTEGQ